MHKEHAQGAGLVGMCYVPISYQIQALDHVMCRWQNGAPQPRKKVTAKRLTYTHTN